MFGEEIWVVITVAEGGALAVTQAFHSTAIGQTLDQQLNDVLDRSEYEHDEVSSVPGDADPNEIGSRVPLLLSVEGSHIFGL